MRSQSNTFATSLRYLRMMISKSREGIRSMSQLHSWVQSLPQKRFPVIFDVDDRLVARTREVGQRRVLRRSRAMEQAIIDEVESGLTNPNWQGILYVMSWGTLDNLRPLYIGNRQPSDRSIAHMKHVPRRTNSFDSGHSPRVTTRLLKTKRVAVGMALSGHPPHGSVLEELLHTARA